MKIFIYAVLLALLPTNLYAWSNTTLKKALVGEELFYTNCEYHVYNKKPTRLKACDYLIRRTKRTRFNIINHRGLRVELEHVVPISRLARDLPCWKKGGRKNCKNAKTYRRIAHDLQNLKLVNGQVNGDRGNRRFCDRYETQESHPYGRGVEISFVSDCISVRRGIQGDIARIYYHMRDTYGLKLTVSESLMFREWDCKDPVDLKERKRNNKIFRLQGSYNKYIGVPL